jgi:hypothetical protein
MSRTIYTEVEIDLSDFDDEDLIEELNERHAGWPKRTDLQEKMMQALYRGEPLEELVRQYLRNEGYCV